MCIDLHIVATTYCSHSLQLPHGEQCLKLRMENRQMRNGAYCTKFPTDLKLFAIVGHGPDVGYHHHLDHDTLRSRAGTQTELQRRQGIGVSPL